MFTPRILITGAGPGGLTLARLLHLRGVKSTIYDLRPCPSPSEVELPSGMLDLHEGTGLAAIRACRLEGEFKSSLGECSEAIRIRNPSGQLLFIDDAKSQFTRPEIPRSSLVDILYRSLPRDTVKWGSKVQSVRKDEKGVVMELEKGENVRGDLIIGADGAWSKVRKLLSSSCHPTYTGIQYITATARYISQTYPHLLEIIGTGSFFALGNGHGIMTHRGPMDSMRVYIAVKTSSEDWAERVGAKGMTALGVKDILLNDEGLFKNWSEDLKEIITVACEADTKDGINLTADIKPIYTLPQIPLWDQVPGITILGDAAHLMAPNGEGVNTAMADALDLAKVLGDVREAKDENEWRDMVGVKIREYEVIMHKRAEEVYGGTEELLRIMHGENGARALTVMFKGFGMGNTGHE